MPANRHQPTAFATDEPLGQTEVDYRTNAVFAELVLGNAHAPNEDCRLGVADRVTFLGLVPNATVRERMRAADAVVVPSRHAFPEGLPLTMYEALTSRTPLIASDHPMFAGHLRDGESALLFPAGSVAGLADAISRLFDNATLYETLSRQSHLAWQRMQCPVKWGPLIERWVNDAPDDRAWLQAHSLAALASPGAVS